MSILSVVVLFFRTIGLTIVLSQYVSAEIVEFPHQISLGYVGSEHCVGSIIAANKILTTADCAISVRAGSSLHHRSGNIYSIDHVDTSGELGIVYPAPLISFGPSVQPIPIADQDYPIGSDGVIISWTTGSANLQSRAFVKLPSIACKILDLSKICGVQSGVGGCVENGASLIINNQLAGFSSYATPCSLLRPNVYINVYNYRDWIMGNE